MALPSFLDDFFSIDIRSSGTRIAKGAGINVDSATLTATLNVNTGLVNLSVTGLADGYVDLKTTTPSSPASGSVRLEFDGSILRARNHSGVSVQVEARSLDLPAWGAAAAPGATTARLAYVSAGAGAFLLAPTSGYVSLTIQDLTANDITCASVSCSLTGTYWAGAAPTTVTAALNRMAAVVSLGGGTPIP